MRHAPGGAGFDLSATGVVLPDLSTCARLCLPRTLFCIRGISLAAARLAFIVVSNRDLTQASLLPAQPKYFKLYKDTGSPRVWGFS